MQQQNNQQTKSSTSDDAALLASLQGSGKPTSAQDRIATLLADKMEEEAGEKATKKAADAAYRKATAQQALETQKNKLMAQEQCPHMKPNFRPATGGQKDHKGVTHMLCQYCQKEFIGSELPFHLRIPAEMVGGPQ